MFPNNPITFITKLTAANVLTTLLSMNKAISLLNTVAVDYKRLILNRDMTLPVINVCVGQFFYFQFKWFVLYSRFCL